VGRLAQGVAQAARCTVVGMSLRDSWDAHAADWIEWARTEGHDHFFWHLSLPALLEILPPPGRRTLDLGCGEGRLSRVLAGRGHRVVGVEASATLVAAARADEPSIEVHVADAADLPLADGSVDLVVASMVLMNLDDLPAAMREVARVLAPGGRLCASIVHPFNSPKAGTYFEPIAYPEQRVRGGLRMTFHDMHRPLQDYAGALEAAGLAIEALREPVPDDAYVAAHPEVLRWRSAPCFLVLRARRDS
jgi:SAM-dependent methyltransferase